MRGDKRAENKNKRRSDVKVLGEEDEESQEYFIEEILSKRIRKVSNPEPDTPLLVGPIVMI